MKLDKTGKEPIMIAHRRTWFYRLQGESFACMVTFSAPLTAARVREVLTKAFGGRLVELWDRGT